MEMQPFSHSSRHSSPPSRFSTPTPPFPRQRPPLSARWAVWTRTLWHPRFFRIGLCVLLMVCFVAVPAVQLGMLDVLGQQGVCNAVNRC
jgi:hypothetical protein